MQKVKIVGVSTRHLRVFMILIRSITVLTINFLSTLTRLDGQTLTNIKNEYFQSNKNCFQLFLPISLSFYFSISFSHFRLTSVFLELTNHCNVLGGKKNLWIPYVNTATPKTTQDTKSKKGSETPSAIIHHLRKIPRQSIKLGPDR